MKTIVCLFVRLFSIFSYLLLPHSCPVIFLLLYTTFPLLLSRFLSPAARPSPISLYLLVLFFHTYLFFSPFPLIAGWRAGGGSCVWLRGLETGRVSDVK